MSESVIIYWSNFYSSLVVEGIKAENWPSWSSPRQAAVDSLMSMAGTRISWSVLLLLLPRPESLVLSQLQRVKLKPRADITPLSGWKGLQCDMQQISLYKGYSPEKTKLISLECHYVGEGIIKGWYLNHFPIFVPPCQLYAKIFIIWLQIGRKIEAKNCFAGCMWLCREHKGILIRTWKLLWDLANEEEFCRETPGRK